MTLLKGMFERKSWGEGHAVLFTLYIHLPSLLNCINVREAQKCFMLEGTFEVILSSSFFLQIRKQEPEKISSLFT